jgi:hypothetical protein
MAAFPGSGLAKAAAGKVEASLVREPGSRVKTPQADQEAEIPDSPEEP